MTAELARDKAAPEVIGAEALGQILGVSGRTVRELSQRGVILKTEAGKYAPGASVLVRSVIDSAAEL